MTVRPPPGNWARHGGARRGRAVAGPRLAAEAGVLVATLAGAASLCRMAQGGLGGAAAAPLLSCAAVGFAVPAVLLRTRLAPAWTAVIGTLVVVVASPWAADPRHPGSLLPSGRGSSGLRDLQAARAELLSFHVPLHTDPGILLVGAVVAGLAGLLARGLLGPGRSTVASAQAVAGETSGPARPVAGHPVTALLPSLVLVAWSCMILPGTGAAALAGAFAAAGTLTLAASGPAAGPGRSRKGSWVRDLRRAVPGALIVCVVASSTAGLGIAVASVATAGGSGPGTAGGVPATALSLTTGLVRIEEDDPTVVLFRARSPVATYWQVGVLTVWRDDQWVPGPETAHILRGGSAPASSPPPPGGGAQVAEAGSYQASVTVDALSSRLLAVPPGTVAVEGPAGTDVTTAGVVAPSAPARGTVYRATAVAVSPTAGSDLGGGGGLGIAAGALTAGEEAQYVALPPIPSAVATLAETVTASAATPLGKAEAMVNWFRSGRFRYTLTPPAAPDGTNPLVYFLTTSRAGSCESFAGAFAVMTRSLGLPTRVAVGFTAGHPGPGGTTVVRGADAHAWPEVYLGATAGWVSFEPTPSLPAGEIAPADVVGPTGVTVPTTPVPVPTTAPTTATTAPPATTAPTTVTTAPTTASTARSHPAPGGAPFRPSELPALLVAAVVVLLASGGAASVFATRRRRRLLSASRAERMVTAQLRAERALRRGGIGRPGSRTLGAHARALLAATGPSSDGGAAGQAPGAGATARGQLRAALGDLETLALLAERAAYAPGPVGSAEVGAAERAAERLRRTLRSRGVRALVRDLPPVAAVPAVPPAAPAATPSRGVSVRGRA